MIQATAINNGTRVRIDHNVSAAVVRSVNAGVVVEGSEIWTAPANGVNVMTGDKWLKLSDGWTALVHMGKALYSNVHEVVVTPPGETFPPYYDMVAPDGSKQRYVKA